MVDRWSWERQRWNYANFACQADRRASIFFSVISIGGSSGILLLRCLALYRFHVVAVVSLGLLWLATPTFLIVNMFVLSSQSKRNGISACDPQSTSSSHEPYPLHVALVLLAIFDSTILILSLIGLRRASHRRRSSPLERMFRKDNIFYYAIVFLCVIPIPIWYICQQHDGRMMPYLISTLACRASYLADSLSTCGRRSEGSWHWPIRSVAIRRRIIIVLLRAWNRPPWVLLALKTASQHPAFRRLEPVVKLESIQSRNWKRRRRRMTA